MKLYDISQEVFSSVVYPNDPAPEKYEVKRMARGNRSNVTHFFMCAHNGTHMDAPFHFVADGATIDQILPEQFVGMAYVAVCKRDLTAEDAEQVLFQAQSADREAAKRILIKGGVTVTPQAAEVFARAGLLLLGVEPQAVAKHEVTAEVHRTLLSAGMVLLEGLRLGQAAQGIYLLSAAPLLLGGSDGAPCRAMLISWQDEHSMHLDPIPFAKLKSREKTVELRLQDEKRQLVKVGDVIVFSNTENPAEQLRATVSALHCFDSFEELFKALPLQKCGFTESMSAASAAVEMEQYYSHEQQQQFGVLGIEFSVQ